MAKRALAIVDDEDDELTITGRPRCQGIKAADGKRCGSFRGPSGFCFNHDPRNTEEAKREARALGGYNSSRAARMQRMLPPRLRPIFHKLEEAMDAVVDGSMAPTRATALASLASASVRVLEAGELEERMRKIEASADDEEGDDTPAPQRYDDE